MAMSTLFKKKYSILKIFYFSFQITSFCLKMFKQYNNFYLNSADILLSFVGVSLCKNIKTQIQKIQKWSVRKNIA